MSGAILQIGDLVEYQGDRWLVSQQNGLVRTVTLRQLTGSAVEVPDDSPAAQLIARVQTRWPFCTIPKKLVPIQRITLIRGRSILGLKPLRAWVPADPLHCGGTIYFHPQLDLRIGEVLVAHHADASLTRINITPSYGTMQKKLSVLAPITPPSIGSDSRYDLICNDDEA